MTSTVTLDATVNPDFSQVESDAFEVEVNQRFPVFFSEKRPFFMEGLGLFNLAGTGGDATMRTAVHTGQIIDPSAGLKITGASGRHTFGLLSSADASPEGERQRIFTIAREVMNFGEVTISDSWRPTRNSAASTTASSPAISTTATAGDSAATASS